MFPVTCSVVAPTDPVMTTVPVRVGPAESTTEPVPVDEVQTGAADIVPVPVCERNEMVVDVEPAKRVPDPLAPP